MSWSAVAGSTEPSETDEFIKLFCRRTFVEPVGIWLEQSSTTPDRFGNCLLTATFRVVRGRTSVRLALEEVRCDRYQLSIDIAVVAAVPEKTAHRAIAHVNREAQMSWALWDAGPRIVSCVLPGQLLLGLVPEIAGDMITSFEALTTYFAAESSGSA